MHIYNLFHVLVHIVNTITKINFTHVLLFFTAHVLRV